MSHSMRFIAVAVIGWIGFRALSLGLVPGAEAIASDRRSSVDDTSRDRPLSSPFPAVVATIFPPIDPVAANYQPVMPPGYAPYPYPMPYGYAPAYAYAQPAQRAQPTRLFQASLPAPRKRHAADDLRGWSLDTSSGGYGEVTPLDQWPLAQIARSDGGARPRAGQSAPVVKTGLDRLSLSAWAMLRRDPAPASLAAGGMLGGSQAGARILWRFDPNLAASVRTSAPIGGVQQTAEIAAGARWQPFARIPVALTAERRQSFGRDAGRSAFALFAEGGVYDRPIVAGFNLDAYLQGGVVGVRDRAFFVDGSATLTRPVWRQFSGGVGVWGGTQPGLSRIDAGPRLSMRVGARMRVHLDYRQRFAGAAAPGSGPVVTIAGDF